MTDDHILERFRSGEYIWNIICAVMDSPDAGTVISAGRHVQDVIRDRLKDTEELLESIQQDAMEQRTRE